MDIITYRQNTIKRIEGLIQAAGLISADLTEEVKNISREVPDLKEWAEKMATWRDIIYNSEDANFIDKVYDGMYKIIKNIMDKKHQEKMDEEQENHDWWKNYYQKEIDNKEWWRKYWAKEHDWQKDAQKQEQENKKRFEDSQNDKDQKDKEEFIADVEWELKSEGVSEAKLNQKLGVSDWKEEIYKASGFSQALSRRSDLKWKVYELSKDFVCAKCGEEANSSCPYKKGGQKYCSYECRYKEESEENKLSDIGKIIKAFQDWMKKNSIEKISYSSSGELVIQFEGQNEKVVEENKLTNKQKEIKSFLKSNPQTREILAKQEYKPSTPEKRKGSLSNLTKKEAILGGIVIVGIIAIIVALIVRATGRNKD